MKAWQIFAVGVAVLVAALLLPSYERMLAGLGAIAMVAVVVSGFLFRPHKDVFHLRTTLTVSEQDYPMVVEHERLVVRFEITRLWLLFLPTFGAVAFLTVTAAEGTTWNFSLLNGLLEWPSYAFFLVLRLFLLVVVGLLSTWDSERCVLRDAEACTADSVSTSGGYLLYSFRDSSGEYYGGDAFPFALVRSRKLARIVVYRSSKPELSKIATGCLFHQPVVIGRGLTDLDEATAAAHSVRSQPAPEGI